jgi:hypothetical protein
MHETLTTVCQTCIAFSSEKKFSGFEIWKLLVPFQQKDMHIPSYQKLETNQSGIDFQKLKFQKLREYSVSYSLYQWRHLHMHNLNLCLSMTILLQQETQQRGDSILQNEKNRIVLDGMCY